MLNCLYMLKGGNIRFPTKAVINNQKLKCLDMVK